jgi:hypothetical protein
VREDLKRVTLLLTAGASRERGPKDSTNFAMILKTRQGSSWMRCEWKILHAMKR